MPLEPCLWVHRRVMCKMKRSCSYCHNYFDSYEGDKNRYCSEECHQLYLAKQRVNYNGKREAVCAFCGKELPKFKTRFCSDECRRKHQNIKTGRISNSEILKKECIVCGKEFETWKSRKICCSEKCSEEYKRIREASRDRKEQDRKKYLKKHPNARSVEEIHKEHLEREKAKEAEREAKRKEREQEKAERDAIKQAKKQANIDYWQNYEAEHECVECGNVFIAHYPKTKYCSKACQCKAVKIKKRYDGITVDKGITLRKLAKRDHNECKLCGLPIDWNDKYKTDKTIICGDMYPSIDHIKPISMGGFHSWDNIQLAHRRCNMRKGNKVS